MQANERCFSFKPNDNIYNMDGNVQLTAAVMPAPPIFYLNSALNNDWTLILSKFISRLLFFVGKTNYGICLKEREFYKFGIGN